MDRRNIEVEHNLHYQIIWRYVKVVELGLNMIPVEYDCLNMCMSKSIDRLFIERDIDAENSIVDCLRADTTKIRGITSIKAFGKVSHSIKAAIEASNCINDYGTTSCIDKLIIFDRTTDFITPCLLQVTYEGMIDDVIGIQHGTIKLEKDIIPMSSNWDYFQDVRNKHISVSKQLLDTHSKCCKINIHRV